MAYYILTHGWGKDPDRYITIGYSNYQKARKAFEYLFDIYQKDLESGSRKESFVCVLKTKGVLYNGDNEQSNKK